MLLLLRKYSFKLLTFVVIVFISATAYVFLFRESFNQKSEWSYLQVTEKKYRGKYQDKKYLVESDGEYTALGILSCNNPNRVWVLLNPKSKPYFKSIRDSVVCLPKKDLDSIGGIHYIDPEVKNLLELRNSYQKE